MNYCLVCIRKESVVNQPEYVNVIKNVFPKIFDETFKYEDYDLGYQKPVTVSHAQSHTPILLNEAKIIKKLNSIHRYTENEFIHKWIGLLQNLPFYITISYLLTRYGLLFTASLVDRLKEACASRHSDHQDLLNADFKSAKNLNDIIDDAPEKLSQAQLKLGQDYNEDEVNDKNILGDSLFQVQNHNYKYIMNLLNKKKKQRMRGVGLIVEKSFLYDLFERGLSMVYTNVPHMKFSKQFVNTYIVAFMIVYFFTLLGLRLASLLNDLLTKCVQLAAQYIYGVSEVCLVFHFSTF